MKLYDGPAPNPWRVRAFLAEKGVECPLEPVALQEGATRTEEFGKINSLHELPVLELDDGQRITESVAICRYFESLHPKPSLFGEGWREQAGVKMWNRRAEFHLMGPIGGVARHTFEFFADKIEQIPAYADSQRRAMRQSWTWLDGDLAEGRAYLAGEKFTIADITGMSALRICGFAGEEVPNGLSHVAAWADRVKARPSWDA